MCCDFNNISGLFWMCTELCTLCTIVPQCSEFVQIEPMHNRFLSSLSFTNYSFSLLFVLFLYNIKSNNWSLFPFSFYETTRREAMFCMYYKYKLYIHTIYTSVWIRQLWLGGRGGGRFSRFFLVIPPLPPSRQSHMIWCVSLRITDWI